MESSALLSDIILHFLESLEPSLPKGILLYLNIITYFYSKNSRYATVFC